MNDFRNILLYSTDYYTVVSKSYQWYLRIFDAYFWYKARYFIIRSRIQYFTCHFFTVVENHNGATLVMCNGIVYSKTVCGQLKVIWKIIVLWCQILCKKFVNYCLKIQILPVEYWRKNRKYKRISSLRF